MYAQSACFLAISVLSMYAQAAPAPQGSAEVVTLPIPTQLGFPTGTVTLSDAVSFVNAHSASIESIVGTQTFLSIEAQLGLMEASAAIGTATQLTAYVTQINSTPVVEVSSHGGSVITVATGTAGAQTTFAGQVFNVVPASQNGAGNIGISKSVWAAATVVLGSIAAGAISVL